MSDLNANCRRELGERGWIPEQNLTRTGGVDLDELRCPDCESDSVWVWGDTDVFEVQIMCEACEYRDSIQYRRMI